MCTLWQDTNHQGTSWVSSNQMLNQNNEILAMNYTILLALNPVKENANIFIYRKLFNCESNRKESLVKITLILWLPAVFSICTFAR